MIINKFYFLAIISLFLSTSCSSFKQSNSASARSGEIVFDDGYKSKTDGEVVIDDKSFDLKKELITRTGENSREIIQIAKDGSQINVTYDGFGNKSEARTFDNNPLLKLILLRTSVDGNREVFVYGRSGKVKSLPENMLDKVLTASASELANSAGIFEEFKENYSSVQNTMQPNITTLQPVPSSQFPIQNQQPVEQAQPAEIEPPAETVGKTSPTADSSPPTEKKETIASTKKPDEQ